MKILARYILTEFIKIFSLSLAAFVTLYLTLDFFENIGDFVQNEVPVQETLRFFLLRIPQTLYDMMPMALLLSTVLNFGLFAKRHELIAIRACGIDMFRLAVPVLLFSFLCSLGVFILNSAIIPLSNQNAEDIRRLFIHHKPRNVFFKQNSLWLRNDDRTIYNIEVADVENKVLHGVDIYRLTQDFQMRERIHAGLALYQGNQWVLISGTRWLFDPQGEVMITHFDATPSVLSITLDDLPKMALKGREMRFGELRDYVTRLRHEGYEVRRLSVDLFAKTAFPFAGFVLSLIGCALALMEAKKGGIALGIALSVALSFLYWVTYSFTLSLGYTGHLPPLLAAWTANLFFAGIGASLAFLIKR